MPKGVPRDHGSDNCSKQVACIYLCTRRDGSPLTTKARDITQHYIVVHGSTQGAYICGVTNCNFSCPKGGGCASRHIGREHPGNDDAFYTYDPTNEAFGPRYENMKCSDSCQLESNQAIQRAIEVRRAKQKVRNQAAKALKKSKADANEVLDRAFELQARIQPQVEGLANPPSVDLPEAFSDESNESNITVVTLTEDEEQESVERMAPHSDRRPTSAVRNTVTGSAHKRRKVEEENQARRNLTFVQSDFQTPSNQSPVQMEATNDNTITTFKNFDNALSNTTAQVFENAEDINEDDVDENEEEEEEEETVNSGEYNDGRGNEIEETETIEENIETYNPPIAVTTEERGEVPNRQLRLSTRKQSSARKVDVRVRVPNIARETVEQPAAVARELVEHTTPVRGVAVQRVPTNRVAVNTNVSANRGVDEINTQSVRKVPTGPVCFNQGTPAIVPIDKKALREHCHEVLRLQDEAYRQEIFAKFTLEMLTEMNNQWLQEYGVNAETLEETVYRATGVDISCIPDRVFTMPRTVRDRLDVKELLACMIFAVSKCDIVYLEMLYVLKHGHDKAIFKVLLSEGNKRLTQTNIDRLNGVNEASIVVKLAQNAVLFNFLKNIQVPE